MRLNFYLIFLTIFILLDVSDEIRLITDHFTFSALYFAFIKNPLSFFMLITFPYLKKQLEK